MLRQNSPTADHSFAATGTSSSTVFTLANFDFNCMVAKLYDTTLAGTSPTLDVYLQTSDDGGVTFYDLAHFTQLTTTVTLQNAYFAQVEKGITGYIGQPKNINIAAASVSGLPLLSRTMKAVYTYGGTIGSSNMSLQLYLTDQDAY